MAHPSGLGEHNARDTLSPQPAAYPTRRRTAVPARSHRLQSARNATCRPGGAGRCRAAVLGNRMWWGPSAKGEQQLHRLHACLELRHHPWHSGSSLLEPTSDRRDPPPSMKPVSHRDGAAASPTGARTARRAPEPGAAARERVLLVCLRWGINSVLNIYCASRRKQRLGGVLGALGGRNGPYGRPRTARRAPRVRRRA